MSLLASLNPSLQDFSRAIVLENKDPQRLGRVRLEYPWLGKSSAKIPSEWARVCSPYASKQSGFFFLPEIGDEVLVYFESGNMESPLVIGALYNEKNKIPQVDRDGDANADNQNNLHYIRSRSGHMLCFDDSSAAGALLLRAHDGRTLELNSSEKNIRLKDADGNQIEIQDSTIKIQNKSGSRIVLDGSKITIEASGSIELGEGAADALVKGTSFLPLFNSHTHTVGPATSTPPNQPMSPSMLSKKVKTA